MQSEGMHGTVLAVDGNSLVHRAFHAHAGTGFRTPNGRPAWAVRGLIGHLVDAIERLDPAAVVVGFDDPAASIRRERWPQYKGQRADKPETLVDQLAYAVELLTELGVEVVVPVGLEADDVLAAVAVWAKTHGGRAVLMTSDRDAFALIDESTSVLRILNGGVDASPLLNPARLHLMLGIRPDQYRDYAALRGDASDNLPGVRGVGPKTGAAILQALGSAAAAFQDAIAGGEQLIKAAGRAVARHLAAPGAREAWELNCQIMKPHPMELPVSRRALPLASEPVRLTCGTLDMTASAARALRVLCHDENAQVATPVRIAWSERPEPTRLADRGRQRFAPLPKKPLLIEQPALFAI